MSILNTMKMVKESGFNAGDAINTSTNLETGIYPVRIKQSVRQESNGHEETIVTLEVVSGNHKDRLEFMKLNFNEGLPEFVREKNGKILLTLIDILGTNPTKEQLVDAEGLVEYFQSQIGKQLKMDLKLVKNKKSPQYPHRNYEFSKLGDESHPLDSVDEMDDFPF